MSNRESAIEVFSHRAGRVACLAVSVFVQCLYNTAMLFAASVMLFLFHVVVESVQHGPASVIRTLLDGGLYRSIPDLLWIFWPRSEAVLLCVVVFLLVVFMLATQSLLLSPLMRRGPRALRGMGARVSAVCFGLAILCVACVCSFPLLFDKEELVRRMLEGAFGDAWGIAVLFSGLSCVLLIGWGISRSWGSGRADILLCRAVVRFRACMFLLSLLGLVGMCVFAAHIFPGSAGAFFFKIVGLQTCWFASFTGLYGLAWSQGAYRWARSGYIRRRCAGWWSGCCDVCGYDRAGLETHDACPECGASGVRSTPACLGL